MTTRYQLAIVDDHPIVIEGLSTLLSGLDHIHILSCFKNGAELLAYQDLTKIDILLMDVFLPDVNGIDLCARIKKLHPRIIVLGMSSQSERSIVLQLIKNGASGYLLKSASKDEFKDCINDALAGELAFSADVKDMVNKTDVSDLRMVPRLTRREKEIVQLLIQGKSTQEISELLFLSFLTVQTHRRNLLNKYQVKNLVELINIVNSHNLL
jgi:DNA-binding NarL/FixJ family response regulator